MQKYEIVAREDFSDVTYLLEVSHPLMARAAQPGHRAGERGLGHDAALAKATIRFGLGRFTTESEVDTAAQRIVEEVQRLRARRRRR